ncbi:MAG: CvpA family protein [Clostridiales bacterium]|jgi:uncharacterized membrane protein required for colicin V production|nr:CvpA family protein [Clostridiales bacterium]
MNYIDYFTLTILFISSLYGIYNGFVASALGVISFFISWLGSFIFYPLLAKILVSSHPDLLDRIIHYTEGASKIELFEERTLSVISLSQEQINSIVGRAKLPSPFDRLILSNLNDLRFDNLSSIGDYFNHTVACIILNMICFLLLFVFIRIVCAVLISIAKEVFGLPVLKRNDHLFGALLGIINGIFLVFFLASLVPMFLTLAPFDNIYKYIEESMISNFFFKYNIFTNVVKGYF